MMNEQPPNLAEARRRILAAIERFKPTRETPVVVALDGKSGAGKSTLASLITGDILAAVIQVDDFFTADIPDAAWDSKSVKQRLADVFDWHRVRTEALGPLLSGGNARWYPFDFQGGLRSDGTYGMKSDYAEIEPAPVILVDGVYSAGPQLADLVNLTVLVETQDIERRTRLTKREEPGFLQRWHARWDAVEDCYFTSVRPRESFDLIVSTM